MGIRSTIATMAALAIAGCGGESAASADQAVTAEQAVTAVDAPAPVERRIVPVDGDLAEIVFALGLGDEVVATDLSATYPPEADALPEIGYQRALAAEPIADVEPSIVLATGIAGPAETLDQLTRLGIDVQVVDVEPSPRAPGDKIRAVAGILGVAEDGAALAAEVDADIDEAIGRAVALAPSDPLRMVVLYLRGENVQLVLGEGSGVDWIAEAVGAVDVADELGVVDHEPISAEALVRAAPDVIVVPSAGLDSVGGIDGLLAIDGLAATPAGEDRRVLAYDDQLLLGNGPRTGHLIDQLISDLYGEQP